MTSRRLPSRSWHAPSSRPRRPTRRPAPTTRASSSAPLYDLGPISRAEIARLTGLTRTSVGELVARAEQRRPGRGSRPRPVDRRQGSRPSSRSSTTPATSSPSTSASAPSPRPSSTFAARSAGAISARPRRRGRRRGPRRRPRPDRRAPRRPAPARSSASASAPRASSTATARSAGRSTSPGPTCRSARILADHYGLPTIVANDSRAAALATFLFGGDERPDNLIAIKVGRGIGAGLVLDGELFGGDGYGAGEIGHVVVEPDGAECHCGRFGCLETVASAPAILRAAAAAGRPRPRHSPNWPPRPEAGDETALAVDARRRPGPRTPRSPASSAPSTSARSSSSARSPPSASRGSTAIRDEATRRSLGPLARETRITDGGIGEDLDAPRRLRAAAHPRARPDGASMTIDVRAATPTRARAPRRPRPPAPRRRRRRRQQDRRPRRRSRRARPRPATSRRPRPAPRNVPSTRSPRSSRRALADGRRDDRRRRGDRRRRPGPGRSADRHRHARRQPRLARTCRWARARGRASVVRASSRTTSAPPPLGLHRRRVLGDIDDLAYLAVGTGISAGVVLDGRLHRGARGLAGEIGHVIVDPGGARLRLRPARLPRDARLGLGHRPARPRGHRRRTGYHPGGRWARRGRGGRLGCGRGLRALGARPLGANATAIDVYRAAASGDPLATEIADAVGRRLAWAVHLLVMAYDVERVVLGGGVSHAGETFVLPIQRELDRMRAASALAREQLTPDIVELLPPGADAGAWGAVVIAATAHAGIGAGQGWEEVGHVRDT